MRRLWHIDADLRQGGILWVKSMVTRFIHLKPVFEFISDEIFGPVIASFGRGLH